MTRELVQIPSESSNPVATDISFAEQKVVDSFTLTEGNTRVKVWERVIEPGGKRALLITKTTERHRDRFEISEPQLKRYDLENHEVIEDIPWPDGTPREFAQILFSPDGEHVFFMAEDLIVFDADTFEEVDRWKLAIGRSASSAHRPP